MNKLLNLFATEPVLVIGGATAVIDSAIILGVSFGLTISSDEKTAVDAFVTAVLTFAAMLIARSQVSPVATQAAALGQHS